MTAATRDRDTQEMEYGKRRAFPVAASALLYAGVMACLSTTGFLTKGATAVGLKCVGVTRGRIDNSSGIDGALTGEIDRGVFGPFANSTAADQLTLADVGSDCYIVDDQTVAKTSATSTRSVAGKVWNVSTDGVWIEFR